MSPRKILTIPSDVHCQSTLKQLGITTINIQAAGFKTINIQAAGNHNN